MQRKPILLLSFPLIALIVFSSCISLLTPNFYSAETLNWQAQSLGQDMIDLCVIVPCLLITSILAYKNNGIAAMIWGGVVLYLTYTFVVYCFDEHFNQLFIPYCLCLGLSFYSLMYFLFTHYKKPIKLNSNNTSVVRVTGIYFITISSLFYFLWLFEIIPPTIQNAVPKSVTEAGLFTNAVHVIDLSVVLPAIFINGIFLLKRNRLAFFLTPMLLTFFVLMDLTIGLLVVVIKTEGLDADIIVTGIMLVLSLISLTLLIMFLKNIKTI